MSDTPEIELTEAGLNAAADQALAAFDAATTLEELSVARRDHLGDEAPIPQARRALGTLPKDQRKDAGRLVNMARGRVEKHYAEVLAELEAIFDDSYSFYNLRLFDITGKVLIKQPIENQITRLSLINLSKGIYFLQLRNANEYVKTFKVVKQ